VVPTDEERVTYRSFNLLTSKPELYAANVAEADVVTGNRLVEALNASIEKDHEPAEVVTFSAKVEAELAELALEDRQEFLASLGLAESGLDRLAHAAYHLLGLQSYFTAGEKEVGPGPFTKATGRQPPPASFTPILRRASSAPKRWPMQTSSG
jgi:ribosome-binding ATPase YchF (GTP1/OBG family)